MKDNLIAFKTVIKQLNYILSEKQKRKSVLVTFFMVVGAGVELLGVSTIYPFLQIILDSDAIQSKWYIKWITNLFPDISRKSLLILLSIIIIVIYISKNLFMLLSAYVQNMYAAEFKKECSISVLDAYLKRTYEFFLNTNSSIILRGIGPDINGVYNILLVCFTVLAEAINVIVLGIFLFKTDPFISLCAMVLASICFGAIVFGFKGKMKSAGQEMRRNTALKDQYSYQAVNGIKEITVLDRRKNFVDKFKKAAEVDARITVINGFISACPDRILEGVCIAGFMGIVCIEILIGKDLNTFIPILGTFAVGAFRILPSISKISSRLNSIVFYRPCLQSTYDNLRAIREYDQNNEDESDNNDEQSTAYSLISFEIKIEIKNICWKYLNAKENVLHDLSLTIHKGESIAFIGASGAGKTTLADMIMGLLKPQSGTVKMDGIDIFSIPHQWCKIVGYVPQTVFLIDDTVRSNVAFGLEREEICDDMVWEALEQAKLREFVQNLPHGLDTIVGERGVKFSGGQRQRIAIARALYENPDILVLDEATSALDHETETAVMESIDALQGSKTLIIVAHRLSTIRNCDKVYEIKDGIAVEKRKEEIFTDIDN